MNIFIAILSIGILIILHELGHFFLAKKLGVKVEEFGIGMPPRILGRKWGETLYSVNALPIGGFVRMEGEEKRSGGPGSFSQKPVWQRFLIVAGGVFVFWIIAAVIFGVLGATAGIPMAITDEQTRGVTNPQVQVIGVAPNSPAAAGGIRVGDTIKEIENKKSNIKKSETGKVGDIQEFTEGQKGQELIVTIQRGSEVLETTLTPREHPPAGEGPMGIALARTTRIAYQWYEAPFQGVVLTGKLTWNILGGLGGLALNLIKGDGLPAGMQVTGPVGVVSLLGNSFQLGISQFFFFIAVLSVYLAIFNTIPIPALDGGRMFFLLLEWIRRKPLPEEWERRMIAISFLILIPLILWVTVNDIGRLF
ncbi:MAG: M50 family metallopeptidase [Patescibacteria group bacterium]